MKQGDLFGHNPAWAREAVSAMRSHLWLARRPPAGRVRNELSVWKRFMHDPAVTAWPYDSGHAALLDACRHLRTYCLTQEDWDPGPCSVRIFYTEGGRLLHAVLGRVENRRAWQREAPELTGVAGIIDRILATLSERSEP